MAGEINYDTGETVGSGRSPRFNLWTAFFLCSVVVLISSIQVVRQFKRQHHCVLKANCLSNQRTHTGTLAWIALFRQKNQSEPVTSANRYIVACAVVTFILTAIIVACHMSPVASTIFVGTKVEGIVTIVLVAFWTAIVAVNTSAGDSLGAIGSGSDAVQSGNLYYFSWGGFVLSVILLVSFLRDAFGVDMIGQVQNRGARLQWWAALMASAIVVLGSAAETLGKDCVDDVDGEQSFRYCRITKWAISAGTINMVLCAAVIGVKMIQYSVSEKITLLFLETASAGFLSIMNIFAVLYITSADAPGSAIGNLYYFSWAIFLLAAMLLAQCYTEFTQPQPNSDGTSGTTSNGNETYNQNTRGGDIEVETLDDNL